MNITVESIKRVFKFNKQTLPDPNPKLSPDEVKEHYAALYPELTSAAIEGPELTKGKQVYTFVRQVGTKGY